MKHIYYLLSYFLAINSMTPDIGLHSQDGLASSLEDSRRDDHPGESLPEAAPTLGQAGKL